MIEKAALEMTTRPWYDPEIRLIVEKSGLVKAG